MEKVERYSSYDRFGKLRPEAELFRVAQEVVRQLDTAQTRAMMAMHDAVPSETPWTVEILLRRSGLIGWSRSGDNAFPLTPLGKAVRSILRGGDAD